MRNLLITLAAVAFLAAPAMAVDRDVPVNLEIEAYLIVQGPLVLETPGGPVVPGIVLSNMDDSGTVYAQVDVFTNDFGVLSATVDVVGSGVGDWTVGSATFTASPQPYKWFLQASVTVSNVPFDAAPQDTQGAVVTFTVSGI